MITFKEFIDATRNPVSINVNAISYIECGKEGDCYIHVGGAKPIHILHSYSLVLNELKAFIQKP